MGSKTTTIEPPLLSPAMAFRAGHVEEFAGRFGPLYRMSLDIRLAQPPDVSLGERAWEQVYAAVPLGRPPRCAVIPAAMTPERAVGPQPSSGRWVVGVHAGALTQVSFA
jgi:hypothetical protein